MKQMHASDVRQ